MDQDRHGGGLNFNIPISTFIGRLVLGSVSQLILSGPGVQIESASVKICVTSLRVTVTVTADERCVAVKVSDVQYFQTRLDGLTK